MDLAESLSANGPDPESYWRVGTVTNTSGSLVVVTVNGVSRTLPKLAWYTPTIGDTVQIAWPKGRPFVLGDIG